MPTRRSPYPAPEEQAGIVIERRYVALFGRLLTELNLGHRSADTGLITLLEDAVKAARDMRQELIANAARMAHLESQVHRQIQAEINKPAAPVHMVQFRALDDDDGVVLRGEWVADHLAITAQGIMAREIAIKDPSLRLVKYARCLRWELTKIVEDEPPEQGESLY